MYPGCHRIKTKPKKTQLVLYFSKSTNTYVDEKNAWKETANKQYGCTNYRALHTSVFDFYKNVLCIFGFLKTFKSGKKKTKQKKCVTMITTLVQSSGSLFKELSHEGSCLILATPQ